MRCFICALSLMVTSSAMAQSPDLRTVIETHVLPGYQALQRETRELAKVARDSCKPGDTALTIAYHDAFDAWVRVSHLRFGPSEREDRAFALAFWPDPRGSTPKTLGTLIAAQDPVVSDPTTFSTTSIAVRGFYALEFLLFEPSFADGQHPAYRCLLVQAIANEIAKNSKAILSDWTDSYSSLMINPGNDLYGTEEEVAQQLFTALSTGLEFTALTRLGRPLGTFDRPRPNRAEARRSERSLRHVVLSLEATQELAALLSMENSEVQQAFEDALQRANALEDPVFAGVSNPIGRLRVEALQQSVERIRAILAQSVGPSLGISAGFNALDGD